MQNADEDYETDKDILQRTINVCKKDVLYALKKVQKSPLNFQESLRNHKY